MAERTIRRDDLRMISELLDGRLEGDERAEALRRIEADEALYEVFVESARYREARARSRVVGRGRWRRGALVGGLLAAALAAVVVVPRFRGGEPLATEVLARDLVARDGLSAVLAAEGWYEPRWSGMRGTTAAPAPDADLAFRAGVLTLDLEIALRARRQAAASDVARRLAGELEALDPGLAVGYSTLVAELESGPEAVRSGEVRTMVSTLSDWVGESPDVDPLLLLFGRWCEAGRLAADSGNVELLTSESFRSMVPRLAARGGWDPRIAAELERLADLLQEELNELQVAAIGVSFEAILAQA